MLSILIFFVIMVPIVILGPPVLGLVFWVLDKLRGKSTTFEDAVLKGYEVAYPNQKKI